MAVATQTMTDEQRKSVALEYLKAFDNGGTTSTGGSILDLFADDAQVYFPKWGIAEGQDQIGKMFGDVGSHPQGDQARLRLVQLDLLRRRTPSSPRAPATASTRTGRGAPVCRTGAPGRWCDVFEIRDFLIQRVLHLPGPGLRRSRHVPLRVASRPVARRTEP